MKASQSLKVESFIPISTILRRLHFIIPLPFPQVDAVSEGRAVAAHDRKYTTFAEEEHSHQKATRGLSITKFSSISCGPGSLNLGNGPLSIKFSSIP
jgi:hypothetical protein